MRHRRADHRSGRMRGSRGCSTRYGLGIDTGDDLPGRNRGAICLLNGSEHTGGRRGHFKHDFVGFYIHQNFVGSDGFARLFFPLQQGGFSHGFGQLRNFDFYDGHCVFSRSMNESFNMKRQKLASGINVPAPAP